MPALDESNVAANLPMRQRLAAHRTNAVCASCHRSIDPVGFSLENFDAIGQWRDIDVDGQPVDALGALPGAAEHRGVDGLEDGLLRRPELFAGTLTENLLTFALGRGVELLRRARGSEDRERRAARRLPVLVAHSRNRQERSVSDEEKVMYLTRKAIPRRTLLKGAGRRPWRCLCSRR